MPILIYTDGSSRGNPGPGGWGAIVRDDGRVKELGGRESDTTNNRMELTAAIQALLYVAEQGIKGEVVLQSDSKYVIQGITQWIKGWQRNGWRTTTKQEVGNRDLWEALDSVSRRLSIQWRYVQGHAGHPGNERCDEIATGFADQASVGLYDGSRDAYPVDLDAAPAATTKKASKKSSGVKAYSYLSVVDGVFEIHKTWAECEARVKGVRSARFKKSVSPQDEAAIKKEWGF